MNHAYHRMFSANNIYINILEQQRPIKHELKQQYATHTIGSYCGHKEKQHPHASMHAPAHHIHSKRTMATAKEVTLCGTTIVWPTETT